jgi:hypothetical protein
MKKLFILCLSILAITTIVFADSTVPKDTLNATFSSFLDMNSRSTDNSSNVAIRIAAKTSFFRYGLVAFDMKNIVSIRQKIEVGFRVYEATSDDYFKSGFGDYPLAVYAMKRNPKLPTSYNNFFNLPTDNPPGDGYILTGTFPKVMSPNDGEKIGTIMVKKEDKNNFVKIDVTDFVNKHINGSDSIFFFLTSDGAAADVASLWIRSVAYGPTSAPKLFLYDEKPLTYLGGGRTMFLGEKDSVHVFFPPTAVAPFSVSYNVGATPFTINNITQRRYSFEVTPTETVTYTITGSSDANGPIPVEGSATFNVMTPTATLSGMNKIYAGKSTILTVSFSGVPPFGFSCDGHSGPISVNGINTPTYTFEVAPQSTFTYSLSNATDKNNSSIAVSGTPVITVIDEPRPVLASGADLWKIHTSDEFGKSTLDSKVWTVSSGSPYLANDELRLPVNASGASYVASQIRMIDKLPNNTDIYIETRVKPLNAKAAGTSVSTTTYNIQLASKYQNRFAMSFPAMAQREENEFIVNYNLSDWKTAYYMAEINPDRQYSVIRDSLTNQIISDYKVFGVSISTKDIIYYIDGVEVKRASSMEGYNSGELVNALKSAGIGSDLEDVAQKAYGYYGQSDWNYNGGYTGDFMALLLGTSFNAGLVDATIEGKYAAIDYLRIFKLAADMKETPEEDITFTDAFNANLNGTATKGDNSIVLNNGGTAVFSLANGYSLNENKVSYFSTVIRKSANGEFVLSFTDNSDKVLASVIIDQYNQIQTGFGENKLYYSSTVSAEPTGRKSMFINNDETALLVVRIETSTTGDDVLSVALLPVMGNIQSPFFYPNIEGEYGHTSLNNQWDLNYRYEAGTGVISKIKLQGNRAKSSAQKFLTGTSFYSVVPKESFASFLPNLFYVSKGTQVNLQVELKGVAPWLLTYTDGNQSYTINNITSNIIEIPVSPMRTTRYSLTRLVDGNGIQGIVLGDQLVKVKSDRALKIYPLYDSYIDDRWTESFYHNNATGIIKTAGSAREAFFRYDISEFGRNDSIDFGALNMFFISNDRGVPVELSLYSIEGGMPANIQELRWINKPDEVNYKFLSTIDVPNPGFTGVRAVWDVSSHINKKLRSGAGMVDFAVKCTGGSSTALLTWRQYVPDSLKWEPQFPSLELDPYVDATGMKSVFGAGANNQQLKVYPNPVTDGSFFVDVPANEELTLEMFNLAGVMVHQESIVNRRVTLTGMDKGTYLIRVKTANGNYHGKVMIQ